jgi:UDP-glucose 4-epimerase
MPAATVLNLARAIIGQRRLPIVVTGIRPGEKLHEIMVSEEEVPLCSARGDYLVIGPMLPELRRDSSAAPAFAREYSSADELISLEETRDLLDMHGLLPGQTQLCDAAHGMDLKAVA